MFETLALTALLISQQPAPQPLLYAPVAQPLLSEIEDKKLRVAVKTVLSANIGMHVLDLAYTEYLIGTGLAFEANPAMKWAAKSPLKMGLVKSAVGVGTSLLLARVAQRRPKLALVVGSVVTGFTAWVVHHNHSVYQDLKRQGKVR
jgi:hypothetical protein